MPKSVGIDLGTTFCAVAVADPSTGVPRVIRNSEDSKTTPSVIWFRNGTAVFGKQAEDAYAHDEEGTVGSFKREMGSRQPYCIIDGVAYAPYELSAMLLRHLKEEAEEELGDTISDAVITVPAYFYSTEREDTVEAARLAGIKVRKIIDEPNAAIMAYGLSHWRENATIMVYDLGGGTFDVTICHMGADGELEAIATKGEHLLGGRDWDAALSRIIASKIAEETGVDPEQDDMQSWSYIKGQAESVKRRLSQLSAASVSIPVEGYGSVAVEVTRDEFEEATLPLLMQTGMFCEAVLEKAGMSWGDVSDILLVGGSTKMPQVSAYLQSISGKKPISHINPDEAVALGAAVQASKGDDAYRTLSVVKDSDGKKSAVHSVAKLPEKPERRISASVMKMVETTAHAMGMIAVSEDGERYINDIIIPANHPRPVRAAKEFAFAMPFKGEPEMEVFVVQGENEFPLENRIPFRYVVTGMDGEGMDRDRHIPVKVRYTYDQNGIISVDARQGSRDLAVRREPVPDDMSRFAGAPPKQQGQRQLDLVMAIDVSGSMSGDPIQKAREAMLDTIGKIDMTTVRVSIVAVSDRVEVVTPLSSDVREVEEGIGDISCGMTGYGNADHPFQEIRRLLCDTDRRRFAIVLADGVWARQDKAIAAAQMCHEDGIEVAAIGFGGADRNFLEAISSDDANALFVDGTDKLSSAFGTIAQSLGKASSIDEQDARATDIDAW